MIGDKLTIKQFHIDAARGVAELLAPKILGQEGRRVITVAGESGAGKSEIAFVLSERLAELGVRCVILQQDDYFVYPPKTNALMRRRDINHVGPSEVRLDLIDDNLREVLEGVSTIEKPLVPMLLRSRTLITACSSIGRSEKRPPPGRRERGRSRTRTWSRFLRSSTGSYPNTRTRPTL
jgi:hypothetical protein